MHSKNNKEYFVNYLKFKYKKCYKQNRGGSDKIIKTIEKEITENK
ncbi:hypothetical protein [Clostridium senegalense]|nr:hypothetical protein [Clostridium senegalense]